ncbi:hypothetical protein FRC07_009155, partial [Ceratobasidium sp. 392]
SGTPPPNLDNFGEIWVKVWWAVKEQDVDLPPPKWNNNLDLLLSPVDEKFKKPQHRYIAGLGKAKADPDQNLGTFDTGPFPGTEELTFCFKYSNTEWLKAEGIAPR